MRRAELVAEIKTLRAANGRANRAIGATAEECRVVMDHLKRHIHKAVDTLACDPENSDADACAIIIRAKERLEKLL